jgi:uridine kinase
VNRSTTEQPGVDNDLPPAEWDDFAAAQRAARPEPGAALVIGIIGDSGSGKKTVADGVAQLLGPQRVTDILLDDYHRYTRAERAELGLTPSTPLVHDLELMQSHLALLRKRTPISNRTYDHSDGTFGPVRTIEAREIVLVHGLLGFPTPDLKKLYDLTVFLQPEPDLLFRWKLRRDMVFRGYTEAEVLKRIAQHLLDAKQYVLPQADLADIVVNYSLPNWEAPDEEVLTAIHMRCDVAAVVEQSDLFTGLPVQLDREGEELVARLPADLTTADVESWGKARFGSEYSAEAAGRYFDAEGSPRQMPSLAVLEVLIAALAERLRAQLP